MIGARLNIKMPPYQYKGIPMLKIRLLSLTRESPYLEKAVFILIRGPGLRRRLLYFILVSQRVSLVHICDLIFRPSWHREVLTHWFRRDAVVILNWYFETHIKDRYLKHRLVCEITLRCMPEYIDDDKSTLVQVMGWCRPATNHYQGHCRSRSVLPWRHKATKGLFILGGAISAHFATAKWGHCFTNPPQEHCIIYGTKHLFTQKMCRRASAKKWLHSLNTGVASCMFESVTCCMRWRGMQLYV